MIIDFDIFNLILWGLAGFTVFITFDKEVPKSVYFGCWLVLMCHLFEKICI
jgi:hypothetical protein